MSNRIYKLGIIGAGSIVELAHLPVLKALDSIEVKWICDINHENCQLLSSMYNVSVIDIDDIESELDNIEICLLTVPYGSRQTYIDKIANKGCAIYIEKPFAISNFEHQQIMSRFPSHKIAVGYQRRYFKVIDQVKNIIKGNIFGVLKKVCLYEGNFHIKGNKSYLSNYQMSGGGLIIESAIHSLDQILQMLNVEDITVKSVKSLSKNKIDYDSYITGELVIEADPISYEISISNLRNFDNGLYLEFENCILKSDLSIDGVILITSINSNQQYSIYPNDNKLIYPYSINDSFKMIWSDFILALSEEKTNYSSASTSVITTKWIEQIYKHV